MTTVGMIRICYVDYELSDSELHANEWHAKRRFDRVLEKILVC